MHARQVETRTSAVVITKSVNTKVELGLEVGVVGSALSTDLPVFTVKTCGYKGNVSALRDTVRLGAVVRGSRCNIGSYTGEKKLCLIINGEVFQAPVVNIRVDTPYYTDELQALSIENPVYALVMGNIPGARDATESCHEERYRGRE